MQVILLKRNSVFCFFSFWKLRWSQSYYTPVELLLKSHAKAWIKEKL